MKPVPSNKGDTTDRIVAAAGEVFGERGFQATTIRQITARAGVNLAAVNYHFKNKNELYVRVLREAKKHIKLLVIANIPGTPEVQLKDFIHRFVHSLLDPRRPAWNGRVIAMEMLNPSPALNVLLKELTMPLYRDVRGLIAKIVEDSASPLELDLLANSIFSQCVFYACNRPIAERLSLHLNHSPNRLQLIADHVAVASIAMLKQFRTESNPDEIAKFRDII